MAPFKPIHRSATLLLRDDGKARVAVVADTHSSPHPAAAGHLAALRPDAILHAGDIGDLAVLDGLARIAPLFSVRGNIDTRAAALPDTMTIDLKVGEKSVLRLLLLHIAVAGPRLRGEAAKLARAEGASLIVCGHSHVPFASQERGLTVFNPGSIGPRRAHLPIVFGLIEVTPERVDVAHIDCETGQPWMPPRVAGW